MKNATTAFLFVLAAVFGYAVLSGRQATAPASSAQSSDRPAHVDGRRARELVSAGALLVDVRTPEEYAGGHIDGARNIPVSELGARLGELPRGASVVVYCRSGGRSASAATLLAEAGYAAHDLGPMSAW